jgi:hypothetical protein
MDEANTYNSALGKAVRQRRDALQLPQDALAGLLWPFGWTRNVVAAVERGVRDLTVPESLALAAALRTDLPSLLSGLGDVEISPGTTVAGSQLAHHLVDQPQGPWSIRHELGDVQVNFATGGLAGFGDVVGRLSGHYSDIDRNAAERFGVEPATISLTAERLWGQSLTEERELRVDAAVPPDATPRSRQAARGHITRALNRELRAALDDHKEES